MEFLSIEFASALASIVVIDLVLAGDNAIVIALAARNLPRRLQRRAILWGAGGAVLVRSAMTLLVVWLLQIPGLLFAGGVMLVWIACKLLKPDDAEDGEPAINGSNSLPGAVKTIVIADMVMGLDNVLAVAGAAHGSFVLVITGLVISVPIVIWGSAMLLRFVERFPWFIYVGAGVLAFTAAKMITAEPHLADFFSAHASTVPVVYALIVLGVLWSGFVMQHRRLESRISARLASVAQQRGTHSGSSRQRKGANAMMKILVPINGSRNSNYAVPHVIKEFMKNRALEIHLLNVQPPFSTHIARFVGRKNRKQVQRDRGEKALQPIRRVLDSFGVPYSVHIEVGDKAKKIAETARRLRCDHIVMSTARKNTLTRMVEDSVTNTVLEQTSVPIELIAGDGISRLERYGIPAGIGAALTFLLVAAVD